METLSYFCDVLNVSLKDFFDEENRKIEPTLMTAVSALDEEQQRKLAEFLTVIHK